MSTHSSFGYSRTANQTSQMQLSSNSLNIDDSEEYFGTETVLNDETGFYTSYVFCLCFRSNGVQVIYTEMSQYSGKVKFTLEHAMKAQRGIRGIALLFL